MIVELKDVSLKRGGNWILKDLNWKVEKGQNWVLLGLNGSGKTSLLSLLNAYTFPTTGNMRVLGMEFGKTYLAEKLRIQIGFVSSSLQQRFDSSDNAFEVVLSGAFASIGLFETPTDEMRTRAAQLLHDLGCFVYANRRYETLSLGEKQRVLIARALMADPPLLILDEPANGLDFLARESLLESIERISKKPDAPTIIYVTHHIEEILPIFHQTLLLKDGKVFASGCTSNMISSERLSDFFGIPVNVMWDQSRPVLSRAYMANK
ncbi:molybdenum ABC transporter ATP-binding protein [Virgibacillus sp. 7505]|uniref:ABC transporter ATP-binding protein n=1 Tax=Virgibacillus sp. 7505 TaxID=2022548 RepID=UPI000BA6D6E0|nr:ABC transporter ATP-binding protein [Virgibacillus sp. 7505]PAE17211.1 molybdenum ABC transporter ATP-binding protein [Virgibacillus sp. 7505]